MLINSIIGVLGDGAVADAPIPSIKANGSAEGLTAAGENTLLRNEIQSLNQEISQLFNKLKNNEKGINRSP